MSHKLITAKLISWTKPKLEQSATVGQQLAKDKNHLMFFSSILIKCRRVERRPKWLIDSTVNTPSNEMRLSFSFLKKKKELWLYLKLPAGDKKQCKTKTSPITLYVVFVSWSAGSPWSRNMKILYDHKILPLCAAHTRLCLCAWMCVCKRESIPHLASNKKRAGCCR